MSQGPNMRVLILVMVVLLAGCGSEEKARKQAEADAHRAAITVVAAKRLAAGATVISSVDIPEGRITVLVAPSQADKYSIDGRKCVLFTGPSGAAIDCREEFSEYMDDLANEDVGPPPDDGENQYGRY